MLLRIGLLLLLTILLPQTAGAAGSKKGKASVTFHLQAEPVDSPKMVYPMEVGGQRLAFRRMAEFETKDFASYKAFPSRDKQGVYDLVFKLNPHAAQKLQLITNAQRGRFMASQLNGRAGEAMMINEQVNDGILVIWGVATAADLQTLAKAFKGSVETQ